MRAEDFDKASIEELQALADKCFALAKSPLQEQPPVFKGVARIDTPDLDDAAKLRLLQEAQFYLTAVARKRDDAVARRDRNLEIAVIVLIGLEIVISLVGMWIGAREGNKQARVLSNIERGTRDTADAMAKARTSLDALAESQTNSLDYLNHMNESLRSSQKMTEATARATLKQLQIFESEQAIKAAKNAKKTKLESVLQNYYYLKTNVCGPLAIGERYSGAAQTKESCDAIFKEWEMKSFEPMCHPGYSDVDCIDFKDAKTMTEKADVVKRALERLGP